MEELSTKKYLNEINRLIDSVERPKIKKEIFPNIFIFGVPRSGTTLFSQALIYCLDVGYINNLIARFYKAPFLGAIISKDINIPKIISFESSLGRTPLISDPHEFGYFWTEIFGYKNSKDIKIDEFDSSKLKLNKMKEEILALNWVFEKPCVFKNTLTGLFIKEISEKLKKSIFIYVERNPFDNAVSLLKARYKMYGTPNIWWSLKPKEYEKIKDKSPEEQVVAQVFFLKKEFSNKIKDMKNVLQIKYEEFCKSPMESIEEVVDFVLKKTGYRIPITNKVREFKIKRYKRSDFPEINKFCRIFFSRLNKKLILS